MQIHWHHAEGFRDEERRAAEERIEALARERTDLIDVRITARTGGHHRHGGQEVRIVCEARGKEIVAARTRPDAGLALNEALDAFEREVWRMRQRRAQRRERPAGPPEFDQLAEGQRVGLEIEGGDRGPQATVVVPPPPDAPSP